MQGPSQLPRWLLSRSCCCALQGSARRPDRPCSEPGCCPCRSRRDRRCLSETSRYPPGTAVLPLKIRSCPTLLLPTSSDDGPKNPERAELPVTTRSWPTVTGGSPLPAQASSSPIENPNVTDLPVIRKSRPTVTSQMPSKTNGNPGEPLIKTSRPTFTGPDSHSTTQALPVWTVPGSEATRSRPIVVFFPRCRLAPVCVIRSWPIVSCVVSNSAFVCPIASWPTVTPS